MSKVDALVYLSSEVERKYGDKSREEQVSYIRKCWKSLSNGKKIRLAQLAKRQWLFDPNRREIDPNNEKQFNISNRGPQIVSVNPNVGKNVNLVSKKFNTATNEVLQRSKDGAIGSKRWEQCILSSKRIQRLIAVKLARLSTPIPLSDSFVQKIVNIQRAKKTNRAMEVRKHNLQIAAQRR